jgi:hypothetical protein
MSHPFSYLENISIRVLSSTSRTGLFLESPTRRKCSINFKSDKGKKLLAECVEYGGEGGSRVIRERLIQGVVKFFLRRAVQALRNETTRIL